MKDGVTEEARSAAEVAWNLGLLTPNPMLISILWCLPFPGRGQEGEGLFGELGIPSLLGIE